MDKVSDVTEVHIKSFHPLDIELPDCDILQGKVRLVLPDVRVQLIDLSMGMPILEGAGIVGDGPLFCVDMELAEPMDVGAFLMDVIKNKDELEQWWKDAQGLLDKKGALLG
jgi:hypothetical protein